MPSTQIAGIRSARRDDIPVILGLVRDLAEYEQLTHTLRVNEAGLTELLFGPRPVADAALAFIGDIPAGFVLFYENLSTFLGLRGLFIEDLYVRPEFRKQGIGRALLKRAAAEAVQRGCGMMEWRVLDWNAPAIKFYRGIRGKSLDGWTVFRLGQDALNQFAAR